jgi:hypothetical protein
MKINIDIIDFPPKDRSGYVKTPTTENRTQFIDNLARLLEQGAVHIETGDVDLEWVNQEKVMLAAAKSGYRVSMKQTQVNVGQPSTCFGLFFFERKS